MTVDALLDLYLDGLDADERLSVKTGFDYRRNAESYVRPLLGARRLRLFTNLYSHVTPTMQREAADRLGKALFS